MLTSHSDQKTT
jgi:hypothetical protein